MSIIKQDYGNIGEGYTLLAQYTQSTEFVKQHTLSNMMGDTVLVLIFATSGTSQTYTILDGATTSDGSSITKIGNFMNRNATVAGTYYQVNVKTNSCVISHSTNSSYMNVIGNV